MSNLITGGVQGFTNYAQGFPTNVISAALTWFFQQIGAFCAFLSQLPTTFDLNSVLLFILKVAGLTVNGITQIITSAFPNVGTQLTTFLNYAQQVLGNPLDLGLIQQQLKNFDINAWPQWLGQIQNQLWD